MKNYIKSRNKNTIRVGAECSKVLLSLLSLCLHADDDDCALFLSPPPAHAQPSSLPRSSPMIMAIMATKSTTTAMEA